MMRPLIRRLSALTKSTPLRLILVVPFILQMGLVVGLTAWLSIQNGYQAVNEVVSQFRNETSNHIQQYLEAYIATPHIINRLNADMLVLKHLSLQDLSSLEQYLWYQLQSFDSVNEIKFGTEQGGFVAVERLEDGRFVSKMASQATGSVYRVYVLDRQGRRTRLVDQRPNYDPRQRPWYKGVAASGKATLVDVYQRFSTPKPAIDAISASLPLYNDQQNFVGIASVDLALSGISQFLHDLKIGRSSKIFIVDRSGLLIGSSTTQQIVNPSSQSAQQIKAIDSQDALTRFAARSLLNYFGNWAQIATRQQLDFNLNGSRQFVQVTPLRDDKGLDWRIVLVVPEDDFTDRINANTQTVILLCIAAFAVATALGIDTARGITTPIFRLSRAAEAIAQGNLNQIVVVKGAIEINVLAQSFNQMAHQLRDSFAQLARTNEALEFRVEQRTAALQASEAKFSAAFHSSPYPICISTFAEGCFVEVNESFCRISEYCLEEIIGRTSTELNFWQTEDRARITRSLQDKKAVRNQEMEIRVKSGRIRTVLLSAELTDLNGQPCILWVAADITERKHMEEALQRSEEKYRNIFENSQVGIFRTRLSDGLIIDANQRFAELFGYDSPDEMIGNKQTTDCYVNISDHQKALELLKWDDELQNFEVQLRKRDGTLFWGLYSSRLNAVDGCLEGVIADISDRKSAEAALQASEAELQLLFAAIPDSLCVLTAEGQFIKKVDPDQLSQPIEDRIGKTLHQIFEKEQADEFMGYIQQVLRTQQILTVEYSLWIAGRQIWFSARIAPIQHERVIWLSRDITALKQAEVASILEERNRMAREIHDTLAQAFTGILIQVGAATQVLGDDPEATQAHLDTIEELARLGLTEARRSVTALRPQLLEEGSLSRAIDRLVTQMRSATDTALIYEIQGDAAPLSCEVENNLFRIGQEALTNSIKYAAASEIQIKLVYNDTQCSLRVKDNGQGFSVVSAPTIGGFGLLGISERAERIGAQLKIESQPGQGTEIMVVVDRGGES